MEAGEAVAAAAVGEAGRVAGWEAEELAAESSVALMAGLTVAALLVRVGGLEGTDCWEQVRAQELLVVVALAEVAMAWAA